MAGYSTIDHKKSYKAVVFLLILLVLFPFFGFKSGIKAEAAVNSSEIVMEASAKRVLNGANIDKRLPMASTTKVMTALVVIEKCNLNETVTITNKSVGVEGSSIYLHAGEKLTVKELLYGLMLRSGNDAATALAIHISGSTERFADLMNEKADKLGLKNTHFVNPHGLHDANHYTSAYDLAVIASEGMMNDTFREIVSTKNITISGNNEEQIRHFYNKNKILSMYDGGNGVKTGFTKAAGRCLVSGGKRDGMQVVAVVLNCPDMFERCSSLMDYAFENYNMRKLTDKNKAYASPYILKGKKEETGLYVENEIYYPVKKDGSDNIEIKVNSVEKLTAPVKKGTIGGEVEITLNNRLLFSEKLYTIESVEEKTLLEKFKDFFKK